MRPNPPRATTAQVTRGIGQTAATDDGFARDWDALRANADIQFAPLPTPQIPETPDWLLAIGRFFSDLLQPVARALAALGRMLGLTGTTVAWVLGALVLALLIYLLVRMLADGRLKRRNGAHLADATGWTPAAAEAQALLQDADRLAAEGRFDEATHLLLQRSVRQIEAARPGLLEPSSTAREIAMLPALPAVARDAFGVIATRVERSLFALRSLSADDWRAARAAYAQFALSAPGNSG